MTAKELVERVLLEHPEAADDNRQLLFDAWEIEGLVLTDQQKNKIGTLTQPETLRRTRCKIVNEHRR